MAALNAFLAALSFLTIFPVPAKQASADSAAFSSSVVWYPAVGLLLGLLSAGVQLCLGPFVPWMVLSVIHVILLALYSGALHLDGLADTCDGLLSSRPREKILRIMRDSRIGAMGVVGLISVLLIKTTALASLPAQTRWTALLLIPLCGRAGLLVHWHFLTYARPQGGLASAFKREDVAKGFYLGAGIMLVALWALAGRGGLAVMLGCLIAMTAFSAVCSRKIGGMTGDTLGAACELCECTALTGMSILFQSNP